MAKYKFMMFRISLKDISDTLNDIYAETLSSKFIKIKQKGRFTTLYVFNHDENELTNLAFKLKTALIDNPLAHINPIDSNFF